MQIRFPARQVSSRVGMLGSHALTWPHILKGADLTGSRRQRISPAAKALSPNLAGQPCVGLALGLTWGFVSA